MLTYTCQCRQSQSPYNFVYLVVAQKRGGRFCVLMAMPMIIVVIATHALHTSDIVNRVTPELHKIDTSSSVELVLETSLINTPKAKQSNGLVSCMHME